MIKVVIIEDEAHCVDRLIKMLEENCADDIKILGTAATIDAGFELIESSAPDVVFLDIQIQSSTGFDLLERFGNINFKVVFTTAFEQYAIRAFKFSAVDYLLKPIDKDDLLETVGRLKKLHEVSSGIPDLTVLLNNLQSAKFDASKKIAIPTVHGYTLVAVKEIIRCKSEINYTTLFLEDKSTILVAKTLKEFEYLLEPYGFVRLHNSHLVNLAYIKSYQKGSSGYVVLTDSSIIEVSERRKSNLLEKLARMK